MNYGTADTGQGTPLTAPTSSPTASDHGNLEFRLLGPVEMWHAGRQYELPPSRARGVLAILLLTPGITVPANTLVDRLWDGRLPAKPRENLSVYVTRLRGSLRRAAGDAVQLTRKASGYALDVDPETVDLHQFRRMCRQARTLADGNHQDEAARLLRNAEVLWTGQALAGIRGEWFARIRHSLEEERRAAIAARVACELKLGRHASLVGELGGLLAEYPSDETFVACLMTALYQGGRTSDALALYRKTRDRLAEELGTEPGKNLADLHQQILRGDPRLAAPALSRAAVRTMPPDAPPPEETEFTNRTRQ